MNEKPNVNGKNPGNVDMNSAIKGYLAISDMVDNITASVYAANFPHLQPELEQRLIKADERLCKIADVAVEYDSRILKGENVSRDDYIKANPDLMPELAEVLPEKAIVFALRDVREYMQSRSHIDINPEKHADIIARAKVGIDKRIQEYRENNP